MNGHAHSLHCYLKHIKVAGKDCIIAVQENGIVSIMNRRGEMRNGFPLDLKDHTISPLYIKKGLDFSNTYFTTVTKNGFFVKFNLKGEIMLRQQVTKEIKGIEEIRQKKETTFELCIDALKKDWIIVMQHNNKLVLFDKKLDLIFEKLYPIRPSGSKLAVQYYNFGADNKIYVIHDKTEGKTYIYDHSGDNILDQPLKSSNLIALMYFRSSKSYKLYMVSSKFVQQVLF